MSGHAPGLKGVREAGTQLLDGQLTPSAVHEVIQLDRPGAEGRSAGGPKDLILEGLGLSAHPLSIGRGRMDLANVLSCTG